MTTVYDPQWLPVPQNVTDLTPFWSQFYNVLNIFLPLILAVVGLGIATVVLGRILKQVFKDS